jgi:membrane protease YdiL (CAAX protease family)
VSLAKPTGPARRRAHIIAFVILAYAFTWVFRIPLAASAAGWIDAEVPRWFQFLGDFGPLLAAATLGLFLSGRAELARLFRALVWWRRPIILYAAALGLPIILFAASATIAWIAFGEGPPNAAHIGRWEELPLLGPLATWLFLLLVIGVGEEVGWRGYMQRHLQDSYTPITASIIVGLAWVFWHLPSFVFDPAFRAMLPFMAIGWALLLIVGSIFLGWLYNAGCGSLLLPVLFHGTQDFVMGSLAARGEALQLVWAFLFVTLTGAILWFARDWRHVDKGSGHRRHQNRQQGRQ